MRILLQQKDTGFYFKEVGEWTGNLADARDFLSSTEAIAFCTAKRISGVQIVLKFDQQLYDIVLPMVADRRNHQSRPGQGA
jgi:hypothetical protein